MGCGVAIGTAVDTAVDVATYPIKEYAFACSYKYDNTWTEPYAVCDQCREPGELLLGLAVSGGGSRSAYFMACVMEELSKIPIHPGSKQTYADEIDYISSVSGGSLASAYFCLQRFAPSAPSNADFYAEFKYQMSSNFQATAFVEYTFGWQWILDVCTYYDRGDLMANVWDAQFFRNATFRDLRLAEQRGAPILIINGTILNDGLKFVFSNLPDQRFNESAYFKTMREASFIKYAVTSKYQPFQTVGFQSIQSDLQQYPVSKAVVASASVPNLLGPVTLKDRSVTNERLIHIVDGGVYDNYGVESLLQVFTAYLDQHPGQAAKILILDGSGYFEEDNRQTDEFTVADYSMRPLSIAWLRTKAYMEYVFQEARKFRNSQGIQPYANLSFHLISLYGISDTQEAYGVLPSQEKEEPFIDNAMLQHILRPDLTTQEFLEKVTTIQTSFKLTQQDAQMIEQVAKKVVAQLKAQRSP